MKICINYHYLFWIFVGFLSLLLVSVAQGDEVPDEVNLSLKTAMAMTIRNNLDLRIDALDSSMAESDARRSHGIYNPYLNLSAKSGQTFYTGETYGTKDITTSFALTQYLPTGGSLTAASYTGYTRPESDFPDDNWTDWYSSVGINIVQPLLKNFGKESTELNITLATNNHEASLEQFRLSVIDTVYAVIKDYNRLYTLRQVLESRERALDTARQILSRIKQQATPSSQQGMDIANTEYAISQRLKDLVDAERSIKDQEAKLRYLIGIDTDTTLIPIDPPSSEEPLETLDQALSLALEKRSDLKQLRLDLQDSELQERVSKRNLLPNLSLSAGAGVRGIDDYFSDSVEQMRLGKGRWWSAGLQVSVPLGNTVAKSDYRRNELRTRQLRQSLTAFRWKLRNYVESDMRALMSARIQKRVAEKAVEIAERRVKKYRKSVVLKTSKVQDLLDAENDWISARDNQTKALEDFANSVALLWKDIGVLLERVNININTRQPEKITAGIYPLPFPVAKVRPTQSATAEVSQRSVTAIAKQPRVKKTNNTAVVPTSAPASGSVARVKPSATTMIYTLNIGEYASSELTATKKKVRQAGLEPRVTVGTRQPRTVFRLLVNDYQSQQAANKELRKLRKARAGGFIIKRGQADYRLYAGSFFSRDSALKERKRLAAFGLSLTLDETSVLLPTSRLEAGRFLSREAALAGALKLEKLGVKAIVRKNG